MRRFAVLWVFALAMAACGQTDDTAPGGPVGGASDETGVTLPAPVDETTADTSAPPTLPAEPVDPAAGEPVAPVVPVATVAPEPVVAGPEVCAELADSGIVAGVTRSTDVQAALLLECMARATAPDAAEQLAGLQLAFVTDQASHPDMPAVTEALRVNFGACGILDRIRTEIPAPTGESLFVDATFQCGQFADFVGDYVGAVEHFRSFVDVAPGDARVPEAEAKLARNMITEARANGAEEFGPLGSAGASGSDLAQFVFRNDTAYEQTLVISGPETRFVTIEASPTSSTYTAPPFSCPTDVPWVSIDLLPGTYDVLLSDEHVQTVDTWQLERGNAYDWCAYYVRVY